MSPWQPLTGRSPASFEVPGSTTPWRVSNYGGRGHGQPDMRQAMASSVNTSFAQLALTVGPGAIVDVAARLGVDSERAFGPAGDVGPAVALGGLTHGVSPLEMAAAYATIADGGTYRRPYLVERVRDARGATVLERSGAGEQVLDRRIAAAVLDMLRGVVERGTGAAARIPGWEVAGKTGTTQGSADAWFVGATEPLVTAVWVGHPDMRRPVPGLSGGGVPARLWQTFTAGALEDRSPLPFDPRPVISLPGSRWVELPGAH
jgi:penicillin-binding protein 1A